MPSTMSRGSAWFVAIAATLAMSVSYVDRQVLAALAKSVKEALVINREEYGWLQAAFSIAYLVMAPLTGALIDRVGARRGLLGAVVVWSAVAALHSVAPSFAVLFAMRIALGTAEAPSFPGAAQAMRRALPPQDRAAGFGVLFTGSSLGAAIAAPLALAIKAKYGWRPAFVGTAIVPLVWIPLWIAATFRRGAREVLDAPGEVETERVPRWKLLAAPPVLRAMILVLASAPGLSFLFGWLPLYFQEGPLKIPENDVGHYLWVPPLVFDAGTVGFGVWASRRDARERAQGRTSVRSHADLAIVASLVAATLALLPLATTPWMAVAFASISMAGGGALYARLTTDMLSRVDPRHVSMAGGLTAAAQSLVHVVAHPLVGKIVDKTHSYAGVLVFLGLMVIPGTILWVVFPIDRALKPAPAR